MYVMTLARDGPASVSRTKNTTSAIAVHAMPSTTTEPQALSGGEWSGNENAASGASAIVEIVSAAATGAIAGRSESVFFAIIGPAA